MQKKSEKIADLEKMEGLQKLIAELKKSRPDRIKIRELVSWFGLPYAPDLLEQMAICLQHFHILAHNSRSAKIAADL